MGNINILIDQPTEAHLKHVTTYNFKKKKNYNKFTTTVFFWRMNIWTIIAHQIGTYLRSSLWAI